jgi:hypothetical protein
MNATERVRYGNAKQFGLAVACNLVNAVSMWAVSSTIENALRNGEALRLLLPIDPPVSGSNHNYMICRVDKGQQIVYGGRGHGDAGWGFTVMKLRKWGRN